MGFGKALHWPKFFLKKGGKGVMSYSEFT